MSRPLARRPYYGWVLVATLGVTETTSWGVLYYAFTVFLDPMRESFHWSRATMTGAFSLALLLSGLVGVPVGRWLDRHGPRLLMTLGSCAAALLVLAWAAVGNLLAFYLVWAAIGVVMAAVLYEPAFVIVATWFRRRRGRALTLLTFMAGFASVIYIPLAGLLVVRQGWRGALVTLAIALAAGTIPLHALVLRRRPQDLGLLPDGAAPSEGAGDADGSLERSLPVRTALHGAAFWWLMGAFFLNTLGVSALFVHLVPYLTDHGYGKEFAANVTGLVGVMALPGRLVLTPLGDRLPRAWVACAIFLLQAFALLLLLLVQSGAGVIGFVVLFGAGFGAVTPARAALVAEFYGPDSYGSISGVLAFFLTGARAIAPVGAGILYDTTGSYTALLWLLTAASTAAAVAVLIAGSREQGTGDRRLQVTGDRLQGA
ncbi:MAG TPA: MFS transporter [Dehalococcoidia bacterium]|nr:MFS transporter [Dehalococcoidia bacterium]